MRAGCRLGGPLPRSALFGLNVCSCFGGLMGFWGFIGFKVLGFSSLCLEIGALEFWV